MGEQDGDWHVDFPGDFGDKRGKYTPDWWKLEGSQYGLLKNFYITNEGSFIDGVKISDVTISDLHIPEHHSIRVKVGVKENAVHMGTELCLNTPTRLPTTFQSTATTRTSATTMTFSCHSTIWTCS